MRSRPCRSREGEVSLSLRGAGMLGGKVSYEPATLRRSHDEVWIAAAGPAARVWMDVILALQLLGMFGLAVLLQRSERRR
jgi:hypothetical protein